MASTWQNGEDSFCDGEEGQGLALLSHLRRAVVVLVGPRQHRHEHGDGSVAVQQAKDQEHSPADDEPEKKHRMIKSEIKLELVRVEVELASDTINPRFESNPQHFFILHNFTT